MRLTDAVCRKLTPPAKGNRIYYDGHGFGLRVTANGARSFVLSYRTRDGRPRRLTIGDFGAWTTAAARAEADDLRRRIHQGEDPLGEQQNERRAETVAELADRFLAEHGARLRPKSLRDYRQIIEGHIRPALGRHKVRAVTFADIDRLHRTITKTSGPYQANRCLAVCSVMFALAIKWGLRTDNPARGIARNKEHGRERYLSELELARLLAALDAYRDQRVAAIFRLLLLTGARRGEVLSMRWEDVDLSASRWAKPPGRTKQKERHVIPLPAAARAVLADLAKHRDPSGFVFPGGRGASGPMRTVEKPWRTICQAAGITGLHVHDLRHDFASRLVSAGVGLYTVGRLLGHRKPSTTARYSHLADAALREASERASAFMRGKPAAEVVPLKRGRGRR